MLQQELPEDFVIATGKTYALEDFVKLAFAAVGLDWKEHVRQVDEFMRPTDLLISSANPEKAEAKLGWRARMNMTQVVEEMMKGGS